MDNRYIFFKINKINFRTRNCCKAHMLIENNVANRLMLPSSDFINTHNNGISSIKKLKNWKPDCIRLIETINDDILTINIKNKVLFTVKNII